ncbi:MAG: 4Fe-4S binding protein [Candidatus Omnitrophica bacterium]|nr:4Fe-4S binding protein [Candidatus Omnitrophota bacterium]
MKKRVVLHFPTGLVDKPIVYRLVKDFDLEFNILKAEVNPKEEGVLVLEIKGDDQNYKKGLAYLKSSGVKTQSLSEDVAMDKNKCVDCTVCIPLCPTQALEQNPKTLEVNFIQEKCIACGICIKACPYAAMSISL